MTNTDQLTKASQPVGSPWTHDNMDHRMHPHMDRERESVAEMGGHSEHSMMKMYLHFGLGDELLISGLRLDTNLKLCAACAVVFLLSLAFEALNYVRGLRCQCELRFRGAPSKLADHDHDHDHERRLGGTGSCGDEQTAGRLCCSGGLGAAGSHCELSQFRRDTGAYRLVQALVALLASGLAFTLMLVAMTYNVCLIFAIVLGESD